MPRFTLPDGRYLNCPVDLSPDAGGQTRAMLNRNRLFVTEAGIRPSILTFNARTDWDERRSVLLERGLILDEIATPNIYEHYRRTGWEESPSPAGRRPLPTLHLDATDEQYGDGTPWRTAYRDADGKVVVFDYLREDGTPFLRIPTFVFKQPGSWPRDIVQVDSDGRVIGLFRNLGAWFRRFVRDLTEGERSFVFVDSRHSAPHIIPMRAPHIHLVYVLHNIHVAPPRSWSSPHTTMYRELMKRIGGTDAFVTLTERQRDDVAMRHGNATNLFVVPNPVDAPAQPVPAPVRDPRRATVVARLEPQKRLQHSIDAFAQVVRELPDARLDIFGSGAERAVLQAHIDRLGLADSVTLRGHDPHARDALWRSSAFIMTSSFEGYPLSTLESLSHGCPVVAYDVKYGPREQIGDGVDGFLVPAGDVAAVAERVISLMTSPELVTRMSRAAVHKAHEHGADRFLHDWQRVLERVVELKPLRTHLDEVDLQVHRLDVGRRRLGARRRPAHDGQQVPIGSTLSFAGTLQVRGRSRVSSLESAELSLTAVQHETGHHVDLPLTAELTGSRFRVRATVHLADVFTGARHLGGVQLRLRMVWQNSTWETHLDRRRGNADTVQLHRADDGPLTLSLD